MAWHSRKSKLTRFFAFKSTETRDSFFDKIEPLNVKNNYKAHALKIGYKAIVVKCGNGETISNKDRFMTAAIDSLAKSIKGSSGSYAGASTKLAADMEKRAIISWLANKGLKMVGKAPIIKHIPGVPSRLASPARQDTFNSVVSAHPGVMPNLAKMQAKPGSPKLTSGEVGQAAADHVRSLGGAGSGIDEAAGALAGQTRSGWWRLGTQGRGDMRNLMDNLAKQPGGKDSAAYKALSEQYGIMTRNRALALPVAGGAAYTANSYLNQVPEKKKTIFDNIASVPAWGAEQMGMNDLAKNMRANPGLTTMGGGAAIAALIYAMMSAGNRNR